MSDGQIDLDNDMINFVKNLDSPIIFIDRDSRVVWCNDQTTKILLYQPNELLGRSIAETIIPVKFRAQHLHGFHNFVASGKRTIDLNHKHVVSAMRADGKEIPVTISLSTIRDESHPTGGIFGAVIQDMSAHQQENDYLFLKNYLTLAVKKANNEFIAEFGDESKHYIQSLVSLIDEMEHAMLQRPLNETDLGALKWAVYELQMFLSSLVDVTKLENKQLFENVETFRFIELIRDIEKVCQWYIRINDITFEIDMSDNIGKNEIILSGDMTRIAQIMYLLLTGLLRLKAKQITLFADVTPEYLIIRFNGASFKSDQYFSDHTLEIVDLFINFINGTFRYNKENDEINIEILVPNKQVVLMYPRSRRYINKILIVEDNDVNRMLLVRLLQRHGYQVAGASNGQDALDKLTDQSVYRPDFIIMDCQMPIMDGFEATRKLRDLPWTKEIPVIALTAYDTTDDRLMAMRSGMDGFITKPITVSKLTDEIKRWSLLSSDV